MYHGKVSSAQARVRFEPGTREIVLYAEIDWRYQSYVTPGGDHPGGVAALQLELARFPLQLIRGKVLDPENQPYPGQPFTEDDRTEILRHLIGSATADEK